MASEGPQVLVVEDDDGVREFCRTLLTANGYRVLEARNGLEGVHRYRQTPCEVVVLDLYMPEKEGLETIRELRAMDPAVKIIAMSGRWHEEEAELRAVATCFGADAALKKPFPGLMLVQIIENLRQQRGGDAPQSGSSA